MPTWIRIADETAHATARSRRAREAAHPVFTVRALQDLADRIHRATSLEQLLDEILAGLEDSFGFTHSMILLPDDDDRVLVTIASRGYRESGIGAEVRVGVGDGILGMVAEARKPIRVSGLLRELLYADAVRKRAHEQGLCPDDRRIPLPGLASPESQLGVPLLVRGELVGALLVESEVPYRFHEQDKASIELLGSYLAIAIQHMQLQERTETAADPAPADDPGPIPATTTAPRGGPTRTVDYYQAQECLLIDGDYVIRSLPAKILWKLLQAYKDQGRVEFSNRELRLDRSLNLPEWRDNLESRLILLRRRLDQKDQGIRILPAGRGRFVLDLQCDVTLREMP